jgi:four helix bundle protein
VYRFEKLVAWQRALDLVEQVYRASAKFPRDEQFGLTSQLRRAATSIVLNLAEGSGCRTRREFSQFCSIALRSQYEVAAVLMLCERLGLLDGEALNQLTAKSDEVGRLVQALANSLVERRDDEIRDDGVLYMEDPADPSQSDN